MIGHQPLEAPIFYLELLQPLGLGELHASELRLPAVEGLLADAVFGDEFRGSKAGLDLLQDLDGLLFGVALSLHWVLRVVARQPEKLSLISFHFFEGTSLSLTLTELNELL